MRPPAAGLLPSSPAHQEEGASSQAFDPPYRFLTFPLPSVPPTKDPVIYVGGDSDVDDKERLQIDGDIYSSERERERDGDIYSRERRERQPIEEQSQQKER